MFTRCAARKSDKVMNYFFFFQAEDGIRDYKVTGVQTCALPIYFAQPFDDAGRLRVVDGEGDQHREQGEHENEDDAHEPFYLRIHRSDLEPAFALDRKSVV